MSSPFQASSDRSPSSRSSDQHHDLAIECLEQTLKAFASSAIASESEIARTRVLCDRALQRNEPADILETLAHVQGAPEERMAIETARIAHALSLVIHPSPPLIPFAAKLIAPSAFYESFDQLHSLGRTLLSPIIYAEDTDAIGTGALNPIAAKIMADEILHSVNRRFGIKPFVSAVRMDYDSWTFLTRKHFGL